MSLRADVRLSGNALTAGRRQGDIKRVVKLQLTAGGLFMVGELIPATPVGVSRALRGGWKQNIEEGATKVESVVSNSQEYFTVVELGRRPGKYIPLKPLQLWAKRKLGADDGLAWGIAKKISRTAYERGIPGQRFATRTFEESIPVINQNFINPIGGEIVRGLGQ